jgi:hypothetical protein
MANDIRSSKFIAMGRGYLICLFFGRHLGKRMVRVAQKRVRGEFMPTVNWLDATTEIPRTIAGIYTASRLRWCRGMVELRRSRCRTRRSRLVMRHISRYALHNCFTPLTSAQRWLSDASLNISFPNRSQPAPLLDALRSMRISS